MALDEVRVAEIEFAWSCPDHELMTFDHELMTFCS